MNTINQLKKGSAGMDEQSRMHKSSGVNAIKNSTNHTIDFFQNAIVSKVLFYRLTSSFSPMKSNKNMAITFLDKLLYGNR